MLQKTVAASLVAILLLVASPSLVQGIPVVGIVVNTVNYNARYAVDGADLWTSPEEHSVATMLQPASIDSQYLMLLRNSSGWYIPLLRFTPQGTDTIVAFLRTLPTTRRNLYLYMDATRNTTSGLYDVATGASALIQITLVASDVPTSQRSNCSSPVAAMACGRQLTSPARPGATIVAGYQNCSQLHSTTCAATLFTTAQLVATGCLSDVGVATMITPYVSDGATGASMVCAWAKAASAPTPAVSGAVASSYATLMWAAFVTIIVVSMHA